jgi:ABC-2 type transport system permease protein
MLKYLLIAKNTLQEYFVYRVNFFFWRLQVFVSFLIFYYLWVAVSTGKNHVGNYSIPQIYSYFIVGYIIRAIIFTTRTADIGGDIQNGNLSTLLLKPISTIRYYFSRDVIDKLFNLGFMTIEFCLILLMFRPPLVIPTVTNLLIFIVSVLIAICVFFFYSLVVSFVTFWSDQAWSSRFLFGVVFVNLFSGQYIPLDLLPHQILNILNLTPFPYLYYYPVRFWMGLENPSTIIPRLLIAVFILIFFFFFAQLLWLKGRQKFQSYGN